MRQSFKEKLERATPSEVCAIISAEILKRFGNDAQDSARVTASHGYYYATVRTPFPLPDNPEAVRVRSVVIRRWQVRPGMKGLL